MASGALPALCVLPPTKDICAGRPVYRGWVLSARFARRSPPVRAGFAWWSAQGSWCAQVSKALGLDIRLRGKGKTTEGSLSHRLRIWATGSRVGSEFAVVLAEMCEYLGIFIFGIRAILSPEGTLSAWAGRGFFGESPRRCKSLGAFAKWGVSPREGTLCWQYRMAVRVTPLRRFLVYSAIESRCSSLSLGGVTPVNSSSMASIPTGVM